MKELKLQGTEGVDYRLKVENDELKIKRGTLDLLTVGQDIESTLNGDLDSGVDKFTINASVTFTLRKQALSKMFSCRHLLERTVPEYTLKHFESTGFRLDINPYKIDGCETHFSNGLQLGPYRMFWDPESDSIRTEKGQHQDQKNAFGGDYIGSTGPTEIQKQRKKTDNKREMRKLKLRKRG